MAGTQCPSCQFENPEGFHFCGSCGCSLHPSEPERRQLTVMFCDLVNSSGLSEQLDPELLRELIGAFREICAGVVQAFGGTVAQFYGDGVEIYFGWPRAHEDDPLRAVCAGMELIAALQRSWEGAGSGALPVRVGIHTGVVVVGEMGEGRARDLMPSVGATPNLAARLQQLARPGTIVISEHTRRLCKGGVRCESLGEHRLRGFSRPWQAYRVLGVEGLGHRPADSRVHTTPLVGRDHELGVLERCWAECQDGRSQVVLISGDAGIGKTRLVTALESLAGACGALLVKGFCSAHYQSTALHPLTALVEEKLGLQEPGPPDAADLRERLSTSMPPDLAERLARLLDAGDTRPDGPAAPMDEPTRRRLLDALFDLLAHCPAGVPTLMVVEDLHWVDPSTLELLRRFAAEPRDAPLLCVFTTRSLWGLDVAAAPHVTTLELDGLDERGVEELALVLSRARQLTARALTHLHARTDGIPLFVEELVHSLQSTGRLQVDAGVADLASLGNAMPLPSSLRDLLTARLDALGELKPLAQVAAVVGRELRAPLLAAVTGRGEPEVRADLDALVAAGIITGPRGPSGPVYVFKHALIQEAAYEGLLRSRRQALHAVVAQALLERFPDTVRRHPEIAAQHFAAAGTPEKAVPLWARAGELALERGAHQEATTQLSRALTQLLLEEESPQRDRQELFLQLGLAAALKAAKGYSAREVERAYLRAQELCARQPGHADLAAARFQAHGGLQSVYQLRGPVQEAYRLAGELMDIAADMNDAGLRAQALRRAGWARFCLGEMRPARELLLQSLSHHSAPSSAIPGSDPVLLARMNVAWVDWFVGYSEQGRAACEAAVAAARRGAPPLAQAYVLCMAAALHQCRGEHEITRALAETANRLAIQGDLPYWDAWSRVLHGWALAAGGEHGTGIRAMEAGIAHYQDTGASLLLPYCHALLADGLQRAGRAEPALEACRVGLAGSAETGACFYDAELRRLEAVLELELGEPATAGESRLWHAIDLARRQGAIFLEMRAALAFARLTRSVDVLRSVRRRLHRLGSAA